MTNRFVPTLSCCFKVSTIILVPMKPKMAALNDCRPVALTSVVMKVLEPLAFTSVVRVLEPLALTSLVKVLEPLALTSVVKVLEPLALTSVVMKVLEPLALTSVMMKVLEPLALRYVMMKVWEPLAPKQPLKSFTGDLLGPLRLAYCEKLLVDDAVALVLFFILRSHSPNRYARVVSLDFSIQL